MKLFSVFDSKLGEFAAPMVFPSNGVAIRSFSDEVKRSDVQNALSVHPEDYSLYYIGELDPVSGDVECPMQPELMIRASDV